MDVDAEREKITQEIQALERMLGFDEEASESSLGSDSGSDTGVLPGRGLPVLSAAASARGSCAPRGAAGTSGSHQNQTAHATDSLSLSLCTSPWPCPGAPPWGGHLRQAVLGEPQV